VTVTFNATAVAAAGRPGTVRVMVAPAPSFAVEGAPMGTLVSSTRVGAVPVKATTAYLAEVVAHPDTLPATSVVVAKKLALEPAATGALTPVEAKLAALPLSTRSARPRFSRSQSGK